MTGVTPDNESEPAASDGGDRGFDTTHWSVVLAAGHHSSPDSDEALSTLCRVYWYPLYAYVRRRVRDVAEAQDLTQEFFARLLEKGLIALAQPERGRFRSFLLTAMKHFLANEWKKARTEKRGGGRGCISLDFASGESRYHIEPVDQLTPERFYDKQWALTLLERVLGRLQDEFRRGGKDKQFELLKVYITAQNAPVPYAVVGHQLGMSETAVSVAVHRLRRRYRDLLRWEIAQTVAGPEDVEDEIRSLFTSLGG